MSEIAARTETVPAEQPEGDTSSLLTMIERASRDPSVDIDKFERLMAMQERTIARAAEAVFNEKMNLAQQEMTPIAADSNNKQTNSRYASYAALDKAVRPIYIKHGFSLSFNSAPEAPENCVRVVCYVSCGGHTRTYQADMPADGKGPKGNDVMTKTHATGSAFTYGQRYLLGMIFNLSVTGKRDDDGNAASAKGDKPKITAEQAKELLGLLEDTDYPADEFCQFFKPPVDSVPEILAKDFASARSWLMERKAAQAANKGAK